MTPLSQRMKTAEEWIKGVPSTQWKDFDFLVKRIHQIQLDACQFGTTSITQFKVGDRVQKISGYQFPGVVVSVFWTQAHELRYVVELEKLGLLHIFRESQLKLRE